MGESHSELRRALSKDSKSPIARLRSIDRDARFVASVAERLGLPLVANLRTGAWYCNSLLSVSARFKSTDAHAGQWAFSLRRANFHLLNVLREHGGLILVDATRTGKTYPDALSKTLPIWACTLNAALGLGDASDLHTAPTITPSERQQIIERIPTFVQTLRESTYDLEELGRGIDKPLRTLFIALGDPLPSLSSDLDIVCLSASRATEDRDYVQGAADDAENWAKGLTSELWWANRLRLLSAKSEAELEAVIEDVVREGSQSGTAEAFRVRDLPLELCTGLMEPRLERYDICMCISDSHLQQPTVEELDGQLRVTLTRALRKRPVQLCSLVNRFKSLVQTGSMLRIMPMDATAMDAANGTALLLTALHASSPLTKQEIRSKCQILEASTHGRAHVPREWLQRINERLLPRETLLPRSDAEL